MKGDTMEGYVEKSAVLAILHECIVIPEVDEADKAIVDYRLAKAKIMEIPDAGKDEIS